MQTKNILLKKKTLLMLAARSRWMVFSVSGTDSKERYSLVCIGFLVSLNALYREKKIVFVRL